MKLGSIDVFDSGLNKFEKGEYNEKGYKKSVIATTYNTKYELYT
jgi:hypothetical protein